jgi:hypothetical protein
LGNKNIGDVIRLTEGGVATNFVVVQKGRPSGIYEAASWDNTVMVLRQDVLANRVWNNPNNNDYQNSQIHEWLNNATTGYISTIAANIRDQIRNVRVPFRPGSGTSMTVSSGASGLLCRVFLPSFNEVCPVAHASAPADGAILSHFVGTAAQGSAEPRRVALRAGAAAYWWLRSPYAFDSASAWFVGTDGFVDAVNTSSTSIGVRPAFVLPSSLLVSDDGSVITSQPPTAPGAMTVPNPVMGGVATTISWGASTDPQSFAITYIVERSINGGTSWTQIYMGGATTTTDTVAFGAATSVMYRVRARNTAELESGWTTSASSTVVNNVPPTAPNGITVPTNVVGGQPLTVTWGTSTSSTSEVAGYTLQRSINGGTTWTDIFTATAAQLSFTDNIVRGWPSVQYQVRAVDSTGATSGWTTSPNRIVDNTVPPTISSATSGDIGLQAADFAWQYSVAQADNEVTTVTETINGQQIRQYNVTLGATNTFDVTGMRFMTILNGPITMTVTATTASNRTATYTVTATKGVFNCSITLDTPLPASEPITKMVMNIVNFIPSDATYQVLACNNANDPTPAWEDITGAVRAGINHLFTNTTVLNGDAFNFIITASRGPSNVGGFISTIGGAFE